MSAAQIQQITQLVDQLSVEDQAQLIEYLTRHVQQQTRSDSPERKPQDLYGAWRDHVSEDFDIDGALAEIRQEWLAESES